MTNAVGPSRTSRVVSVSLAPRVYEMMEKIRKQENKSRSELFKEMIRKYNEDKRWEQIYRWGRETAKRFKIKSEADVDRILHAG